MHIQKGGTWPELYQNLLKHEVLILRVDSDSTNWERTIRARLKEYFPINNRAEALRTMVVSRAEEHDDVASVLNRHAYLISISKPRTNKEAKKFLLQGEY